MRILLFSVFTCSLIPNLELKALPDASTKDVVEETQHAICNIATKEVQATANASITRQLKGVCNSDDMHEKLLQLERRIVEKIIELQSMIAPQKLSSFKNLQDNSTQQLKGTKEAILPDDMKVARELDLEVVKFNGTIQDEELGRTFVYYWVIEGVQKLLQETDIFINSPQFYVAGCWHRLKFVPHHLGSKYSSFELDSYTPFFKKYRFVVLNQSNVKNDLTSQLLSKLETFVKLYRLSYEKLNKYIHNNSVVVKVLIYLDL